MAFKAKSDLKFGISAEYWKLQGLVADFTSKELKIAMGLYLNEEARKSGCDAITVGEAKLPFADISPEALTSLQDLVYNILKTQPGWKEAEPV